MTNRHISTSVGRPTKYTPEIWEKIDEYLNEAIPQNMKIPTNEGLCLKLGINPDTLYDWAKKYPDFSETLGLIKRKQKEYLTEIGIFGGKEINANIVALFLKANHGMVETQRTEITGASGEPIAIIGYSDNDSAQLRSEKSKRSSPSGIATSSEIPSPQLASQSEENNSSDKQTD